MIKQYRKRDLPETTVMSPDALLDTSSDLSSGIAVTWAMFGVCLSTATTQ